LIIHNSYEGSSDAGVELLHLAVSRPALIGFYEAQDKQISTATTS